MRHITLPLLLAFGLLFGAADPASAQVRHSPERTRSADGFRVCNKTSVRIEVAKAVNVKSRSSARDVIVSQGWYKLNPGRCIRLYRGRLKYRYYLVFAQEINGSRTWGGDIPVCVSHHRFKIRSGKCRRGYNRRMFEEVDTGNERYRWTHSFTD